MKGYKYLIFILLFVALSCRSAEQDKAAQIGLSVSELDSLLDAKVAYKMTFNDFELLLDSLKQRVDKVAGVDYYFAAKRYGYNLNHSLAVYSDSLLLAIPPEQLLGKTVLNNEALLENTHYKQFVESYLDLTAKYQIAADTVAYTDHIFMSKQLDIANSALKGKVRAYALFRLAAQQILTFGHEGSTLIRKHFEEASPKAEYRQHIDSLFLAYDAMLSACEAHVYHISGNDTLSAYVTYPEGTAQEKRPCILMLHGGGWYIGRPMQMFPFMKNFNDLGFVAVSIEYRIKGRQDVTPIEGLMDAKAAVRWLREQAGELGIDTSRIVISGQSAGGHLAAAVALIDDYEYSDQDIAISSRPDAVLLWSSCVDPTLDNWFYYCLNAEDEVRNLSPTHHIKPGIPPFLVFQGTNDEFLDHQTHIDFKQKIEQAGGSCKLIISKGAGHHHVFRENLMPHYKAFIDYCFETE